MVYIMLYQLVTLSPKQHTLLSKSESFASWIGGPELLETKEIVYVAGHNNLSEVSMLCYHRSSGASTAGIAEFR